jgi:DNA repair photolyase
LISSRRATFTPYQPKTILNKSKRADHWFWTRYSAYPYIGCQHGCEFCYCREQKYSPYDDPDDFAYVIKVKENAPQLLRRALSRAPVDAVFTGDYQPAERKFQLSRRMLEVCLELGFPVFVLTRSPLVLRDLDLLVEINQRARAVVAFSMTSVPGSPAYASVSRLERLAPSGAKRLECMQQVAQAGLLTGVVAMPLLPGLCDRDENLVPLVEQTAAHGGSFILPAMLTLSDQQRGYFLGVLRQVCPDLLPLYERLYPQGRSYSPVSNQPGARSFREVALRLRELCQAAGIHDRMPRPVIPGEKRELNKRVVEQLAAHLYTLEITGAPQYRQWAYRKAAWAVEDLEQDLGLFYRTLGRKGLESLPGIGPGMAKVVEDMIIVGENPIL